jgi:predicted transcriptional regulator
MATLLEMAKDIVAAHAQTTALTTDELIREIHLIHAVLQQLESGSCSPEPQPANAASAVTTLTLKQAFKTNEVVCMICGKGGMKTLTRHLNQAHQVKPSQYRKQFGIPKSQSLMSRKYAETRKQIAATMDLGANLEKARAARKSAPQNVKSRKK